MNTKVCNVEYGFDGYGWNKKPWEKIEEVCILAVHLEKPVSAGALLAYRRNMISLEDYRAIKHFDQGRGTPDDLTQMQDLAKHLKVKLNIVGDSA